MIYEIEPSGRTDGWAWQVRRSDGVVIGLHQTKERAEAFAQAEALRLGLARKAA
jgi:hypothetical protein